MILKKAVEIVKEITEQKALCDECSYYRKLEYKPELDAHLCELCYDLPIK
jgi:hypothetical protein